MLKIYNTLSKKKETLRPKTGKKLKLFVCGPTVYDFSHLGHARTYIAFDMIVKYLRQKGFDVFYLQNITDIDDKIILKSKEKGIPAKELAERLEKEYLRDMKDLGVTGVTKYARATGHIKEIISQTERLLKKGYAYETSDGVYYDISKFKGYGKLSGRTALGAEDAVSRIDEAKEKRNKGDFCLWKLSRQEEPSWKSPWGQGRPGWHIEDTAITEKYFGSQYDIHGGARDLIFPHHEAEIAQMEAITGKSPLVRYWLHTGFLTIEGQKMSKSLGNFITIRDFLKNNDGRLLRFLILKSHYLSPLDYSERLINQTKKELERIDDFLTKCRAQKTRGKTAIQISKYEKDFNSAMEDDFNTPKAMAAIFELVSQGNSLISQNKLSENGAKDILEFLKEIDGFFGFIFSPKPKEKIPKEVLELAKKREACRKENNWRKSDDLREEIKKLGWQVEDTKEGPRLKKL